MATKKPELYPPSETAAIATTGTETAPMEVPPSGDEAVREKNGEEYPVTDVGDTSLSSPVLSFSEEETLAADQWHRNKRIAALWSIDQNRNCFIGISGVGWKKLSTRTESGVIALNMLASHAREKNAPVSCLEGKDGMIRQIYVW